MKKLWSIVLILALVVAPCVIAHVPGSGAVANAAALSGAPHDGSSVVGAATGAGAQAQHTHSTEHTHSKAHLAKVYLDHRSKTAIAPHQTALAGLVHNHFDNNQGDGDTHDCEQNCNGWMSAGNNGAASSVQARLTQPAAGPDPLFVLSVYAAILRPRLDRAAARSDFLAGRRPHLQRPFDQLSVLERTGRLRI